MITFDTYITEIGNSRKPYPFKVVRFNQRTDNVRDDGQPEYVYTAEYRFKTDERYEYFVSLDTQPSSPIDLPTEYQTSISFGVLGSMFSATDAGLSEAFRVMGTTVKIIRDHVDTIWKDDRSRVTSIEFTSSRNDKIGTGESSDKKGHQRIKLYKAFAKKEIPGVKFKQSGQIVTMQIPDKYFKK